ncbi:MAG: sigma-70 family RNA polymerase sigma factor [Planctomycetes bacterium]|nr:sigma-70 family RNA polymerase sigma factor [Planctomycetota bacterium]
MPDTNSHIDEDNLREAGLLEVFLQEQDRLKRIIAGMGMGAWDAEDILQDVSIKALKNNDRCKERGKALGWLIKVTVNRCITEHRRRKSFAAKALELLDRKRRGSKGVLGPDENAVCSEEKTLLHTTLLELDRKVLMTLVLRYFCDMNASEISEILNITPSAVRNRISRGREVLAKKLAKRGVRP